MAVWTVKGGKNGEAEATCLEKGLVGKGSIGVGSIQAVQSIEDITRMWAAAYPSMGKNAVSNHTGQLWSLVHKMQDGELVVLPLKTTSTIAVGRISGPYEYHPELNDVVLTHTRPVKWLKTDLPRDAFDQDLLYSFGAFITIGRVQRERAEERILAVAEGKPAPKVAPSDEVGDVASDEPDIEGLAREQVRAHISQRFAGHDLTRLVEAVLNAQGFATSMSAPGADGGVDILGGWGPLGIDQPRLAVQVKTGQAGVDEFRSLKGVMAEFGAGQALLVAWGGYKGTVRQEARKSHFSVRLWDADSLLDSLFETYEELPGDIRSELPLQRVWALVPPDA